jgi:HEAT repeat protein
MHSLVNGRRLNRARRALCLAAVVALASADGPRASEAVQSAQEPQVPQSAPTPLVRAEEVQTLAVGWALINSDPVKAAANAESVLAYYPRSLAAATLLLEAEIARGGAPAGLAAYERWLGGRKVEDGYLLRRAARAVLWASTSSPEIGVEALQYLAADDDVEARTRLAKRAADASLAETAALARLGDETAVRRLIDQIQNQKLPGNKMYQIDALIASKSPLAVPALTSLLNDKLYPERVAAAANGLGMLGAREAIPELRRLYQDDKALIWVRFMAAAGLYQVNDMTGLPLLQKQLTADDANVRVGAARVMAVQPGTGGPQPDPTWQTVVRALAVDPDPAVRVQAAPLIAPFDHEAARISLEGLLKDDNPAIRELASRAIVRKVAGDFTALRRFLAWPDGETRIQAASRVLELTR